MSHRLRQARPRRSRSRQQTHRVDDTRPIYSVSSSLSPNHHPDLDEDDAFTFLEKLGRISSSSAYLDILRLLSDIHASSSKTELAGKIQRSIGVPEIIDTDALAQFVTFAMHKIITTHYYARMDVADADHTKHAPNWLSLLFHHKLQHKHDFILHQRLNLISPILSLFPLAPYYRDDNHVTVSLITALITIRNHVPHMHAAANHDHTNHSSDYTIDEKQLFGESVASLVLLDLCKYIASFLDLASFFKCSMINHCWLNFIYRHDTFLRIFKQMTDESKRMQCQLFDHCLSSQVHIANSPILIGWTLKCPRNSYLDGFTLKNHWFQRYTQCISVALLEQIQDETCTARQVQQQVVASNKTGFDCMAIDQGVEFDRDSQYSVRLKILAPFESVNIRSNAIGLQPKQWTIKYEEAKVNDEQADKNENDSASGNSKSVHTHKFWFEFYSQMLDTLNTNDVVSVLKKIRLCQRSIETDAEFVRLAYTEQFIQTLVHYMMHENVNIKLNAIRCLRRVAIYKINQSECFLPLLAKYGLIRICHHTLMKTRDEESEIMSILREQMAWFLGYFVKKKQWLIQPIDVETFLNFIVEEIRINPHRKETACFLGLLCRCFTEKQKNEEQNTEKKEEAEHNEKARVLNVHLGKQCIEVVYNTFTSALLERRSRRLTQENTNEEMEEKLQIPILEGIATNAIHTYSMTLAYFRDDIGQIIDVDMLQNILNDIFLIADEADSIHEKLILRMIKKSMYYCIDHLFRLNMFTKQIFEFGYIAKLSFILKTMAAQFRLFTVQHDDQNATDHKAEMSVFEVLFDPILEAFPMITSRIDDEMLLKDSKTKLSQLLLQILEIAKLHDNYLRIMKEKNEAQENKEEVDEDHDQMCCIMSCIWCVLVKYGESVRKQVVSDKDMMMLIEQKWASQANIVTQQHAKQLLQILKNEEICNMICTHPDKVDTDVMKVLCACGEQLQYMEAKNCYPPSRHHYLFCDWCREKIDYGLNPHRMIYHCDRKEDAHPHGFDLCVSCAKSKALLAQMDVN